MNKILLIIIFSCFISKEMSAQDSTRVASCSHKFVVDAGPEINVCENGSVQLSGIIGGEASRGTWIGGKGKFEPNRKTLTAEYSPDSTEFGTTVVLTLVGDNPNYPECPKVRSLTRININLQPKVSAGENQRVCQGSMVKLKGKLLEGKAKQLLWSTSGTGLFSDVTKADATYTPSDADAGIGAVRLTLKAIPFGVCLPDSGAIAITIQKVPLITLPENLSSKGDLPIPIDGKVEGDAKLAWKSSGNGKFQSINKAVTAYTPSVEDLAKGNIKLTLTAKGDGNCVVEKSLLINLK